MSESIKFRSSVNGFNRNEVISYIENLLKEKEQLLRENELLKAECAAKGDEAEAVRKELAEEKKKCDREIISLEEFQQWLRDSKI